MIVGTAGHVDHGKTTLVRALTGVDTDRLPEEKARGISIELGYAFMDVPDAVERIGFIDVPGHERLVHTMISGATGIDFGLLLVAADDGVMPQTREHLAVLSLLGLARGAVAITKVDRVDPQRVEQVRAEVDALLADTALANVPVLAVSAQTGEGVALLRELLFDAARATTARHDDGRAFRLAIDRAFTLGGIGVVVTGTVHAGRVKIGDELALVPSADGLRARVRSLHAQNASVDEAHAGQRCAIGLVGIAKDRIERGQWLAAPCVALATDRLDARITLRADEAKALRSGATVHVHLGSRDVMASVAVLSIEGGSAPPAAAPSPHSNAKTAAPSTADTVTPGATVLVQLVLREPIGAWRGDRVVLRDASASRTIGGGEMLDPFAPTRYRRTAQRLAELAAWSANDAPSRLRLLLDAAPFGVSTVRWAQAEGLDERARAAIAGRGSPDAGDGSVDGSRAAGDQLKTAGDPAHDGWALADRHRQAIADAAVRALRDFHARDPELLGPDPARLRRLTSPRLPEPLWLSVLDTLEQHGRIAVHGAFVHLPEHGLRLSAIDERLSQKIAPLLANAGFDGAWARDLARDTRESEPLMRVTLARLAQRGDVHQVVKDLCYAPQTMVKLAAIVRAQATTGEVTVARFRDETGLGRKRAIQILEYFDRIGLLRRVGDQHRLRTDSPLFLPDPPGARQ